MRTTTATNGTVIKYPDAFGFVFCPSLVKVTNTDADYMKVTLTDESDNTIDSIKASARDGKAHIDLSAYVQTLFDTNRIELPSTYPATMTDTFLVREIYVNVLVQLNGQQDTFEFHTTYVWGAPKSLEVFNRVRKVRYFTNYPFALSVFSVTGAEHYIVNDGTDVAADPDSTGMWLMNLNEYETADTLSWKDDVGVLLPIDDENGFTVMRVRNGMEARYNIVFDKKTNEGVYLRWFDRCGFLCHFLFKLENETINTADENDFIRNNIGVEQDYGFGGAYGVLANKTRNENKVIGAPQLDRGEWWWIADIVSSPIVQMYLGNGNWQNVRINGGSFKHDTETDLQDFACTLIIDDIRTQRL